MLLAKLTVEWSHAAAGDKRPHASRPARTPARGDETTNSTYEALTGCLASRYARLRDRGLLTLDETASAFGIHPQTSRPTSSAPGRRL